MKTWFEKRTQSALVYGTNGNTGIIAQHGVKIGCLILAAQMATDYLVICARSKDV